MNKIPKYMRAFNWAWGSGYKAGFAAGKFAASEPQRNVKVKPRTSKKVAVS